MFGNESKTQAEILKMKPYAEFLRQFNTFKDVGGMIYSKRSSSYTMSSLRNSMRNFEIA